MRRRFKQQIIPEIEITGIADKGMAVGRDPGGQVIFVDGVVPGDIVDVLIYQKKKGFLMGRPQAFRRYSPDRLEPFCEHFELCGGCKWQHLAYEAQVRHKQEVVENALKRIGKVEIGEFHPILAAKDPVYYRNKLEFSFSSRRWLTREERIAGVDSRADVLGLHPPGSFDKVIDITHCWLQPSPSNEIRNGIRALAASGKYAFFDIKEKEGFLRTLMIRTTSLGETLVLMAFFRNDAKRIRTFLDEVLKRFPEITTLIYCINPKLNDTMLDLDMIAYHGKGYVEERLGHVRFRIGPKSFFQTNVQQAEVLYDITAEFAGLKGHENVYDLYTGIGSIALYVAERCRQVVGIEEVPAAIEDARENATLNGITNAVFYAGDVRDILTDAFAQRHGRPDVLITDPPRAGMHPDVVQMLLRLAPPRIVYVSCNPATQGRDLHALSEDYDVLRAQPVDMFPHTHHVESVALLERKSR